MEKIIGYFDYKIFRKNVHFVPFCHFLKKTEKNEKKFLTKGKECGILIKLSASYVLGRQSDLEN